MTSAIRTFNKLGPRMKCLYVTSLILSVALIVFGAVLLTSTSGGEVGTSSIASKNSAGKGGELGVGDSIGSDDIASSDDDMDVDDNAHVPTASPVGSATSTISPATVSPSSLSLTSLAPSKHFLRPSTSTKHPSSPPATNQPFSLPPTTKQPSSSAPSPRPSIEQLTAMPTTLRPSDSPTGRPISSTPTIIPTDNPTESPSSLPSTVPTLAPSSSIPPTLSITPTSSHAPTRTPLFPPHSEPSNPNSTYFNYNITSKKHGPSNWGNVTVRNSTENYWREFGFVENQCGDRRRVGQSSPVDLCTRPERHCVEYHEFRSKRGDFTINGEFMIKQILPNKLRILVPRRTGEEPDPPHVDFSGVGYKDLDLLNIDIKFPSEHTICGRRYDGEMQYYFFHPVKRSLLVVTWLLEAREDNNPINEHMQLLIDSFQEVYNENEAICLEKNLVESTTLNEASSVIRGSAEALTNATNYTASEENNLFQGNRKLAKNNEKKGGIWDPFHEDIQKTIHFWGYTGSLTEPPCTGNTLWRIMDVPVQITVEQLTQMQNILFNNRDSQTCAFASNHYKGSVARPIAETTHYYKCTRSDYVSDDEREVCGDGGCAEPFGTGLDRYVNPIIHVTGPPSESPTTLPSSEVFVDGPI